jgi:FlgD Ig-like domain
MGDVTGAVTRTLLHAATYLKDNRLPPKGFTSFADHYKDIAVSGAAINDVNFNKYEETEGSGHDIVKYNINIKGQPSGAAQVTVELLYQSINPAFIEDISGHDSPAISTFLNFYEPAEKLVEVIQTKSFSIDIVTGIKEQNSSPTPNKYVLFQNYPNPFNNACVIPYQIPGNTETFELAIFDMQGRLIKILDTGSKAAGSYTITWDGRTRNNIQASSGVYIVILKTNKIKIARKIIMLK